MKKVLYVGLDVHKESIVVATALQGDTAVELHGQIGGTLDALDTLLKKLEKPSLELRFVYEAGPCGYVIYRHYDQRHGGTRWMATNCGRKCLSIWERTILIAPMKLVLILCTSLLLGDVLPGAEVRLADINGGTHQPLVVGERKAVVLIFLSPFCPTANALTPEINRIASEYADRFAFYIIEADAEISVTDAKKHAETLEIKAPVLLDPKQEMARLTKAKTTPEAVVLGSEGRTLYQGRINDLYATQTKKLKEPTSHDLRDALDAIAKGKPVSASSTKAIGCSITLTP